MLFLLQHLSPFSCSLSCRRTNPLRLSSTSRNCFHIALSLLFSSSSSSASFISGFTLLVPVCVGVCVCVWFGDFFFFLSSSHSITQFVIRSISSRLVETRLVLPQLVVSVITFLLRLVLHNVECSSSSCTIWFAAMLSSLCATRWRDDVGMGTDLLPTALCWTEHIPVLADFTIQNNNNRVYKAKQTGTV